MTLLIVASGCKTFIYPGRDPQGPKPKVPMVTPREQSKVTMPDYIIEPPDILAIEAISLIPKDPYKLRPLDVVSIYSSGLPEDEVLAGEYTIQPNGNIQFGRMLGSLSVAGKTVEQLQQTLEEKLAKEFKEFKVWASMAQIAAQQQIAGEHLVAPDGKVNLGTYGQVRVVGMTIPEARAEIEAHLAQYLEEPEVAVDVLGYNSKVFYVITQGAGLGDSVITLPSKGNETVLDAIGQIQGLQSNSSTRMWIARPGYNQCGGDQILPVDWVAVTQRGDIKTNYQVLPGDRLYVSEDKLVALDTRLGKIFSPLERIFGTTLLGSQTVSRLVFFDRGGNQFFSP